VIPLGLLVTALACLASEAAGEGPVAGPPADVAVLQPASDDPVLVAASARIRLELGASGLTSALVDGGDAFPARVALVREDGVATIDVIGTLASGAPLHRRVRVPREDGGDDPAVLAVRAVELLRGIRLGEAPVTSAPPRATPAAELRAEATADATSTEQPEWRFEAGAGVLSARPYAAALGLGPTFAAAAGIASHVSIIATFAGPFFTDRPPTPDGSAHTHEEMGGVGLRLETWRPRVNLHALATVGIHHMSATYDMRGAPPGPPAMLHVLTPQSIWNPAVTLAAGASVRLSPRVGVSLQVAALVVQPSLELVANGRSLGTLGSPSLLPTLSAWTTL
jgi:hypothetical protein